MSFQHFRLGHAALAQPLPPHLLQVQSQQILQGPQFQAPAQTIASTTPSTSTSKAPYGSGDHDDGYSLVFPSLAAFHAWREQEEETQMVEFVKGDTHGSKAVPPRFKDHTKLVCARHSRSGRKKYVKKHPERVRKVPSRKLEGQGCSASISFKTYFDTEEVRACYNNHHSHEIGIANLPFTRRGRKAAVQQEKLQSKRAKTSSSATPAPGPANSTPSASAPPIYALPHPFPTQSPPTAYPQPQFGYFPQQHPPQPPSSLAASQERWDRMSVLFNAIRTHAQSYEYPGPSVVALESVLIRLYLESPVGGIAGAPGITMPPPVPNGQVQMPLLPPNGNVGGSQVPGSTVQANINGNADANTNGLGDNRADDENGITDEAE